MRSDIDPRTGGPTTGRCVLLGDGEGTIVWSGPDAADALGRPAAAVTGRTVASLLGPSVPDPPGRGTAPVTDSVAVPADTDLTTRQRTVLKAAYLSGYFDWPRRRTTGEELAGTLDIAASTLHQHRRVASAKVFEQYFDGAAGDTAPGGPRQFSYRILPVDSSCP